MRHPKTKNRGFTLLEMTIVIVIVGIAISSISTVLPSLVNSAKGKKTDAILERFNLALKGYVIANGCLPCPDTDGDGHEDRDDKGTSSPTDDTCAGDHYAGKIPFRTLGISVGNDAWNKPLKYGVYKDLVNTTKSSGSNPICPVLRNIINYYAPAAVGGGNAADGSKLNTAGTVGATTITTNRAYVIVSGGQKNLDGDGDDFFDGLNEGNDVFFDDPERIESHATSGSNANDYDDRVRAASFTHLSGQLLCSNNSAGTNPLKLSENSFNNGCGNVIDDDGDGFADCADQDCKWEHECADDGSLRITTTSLPIAKMNAPYSATLEASGGTSPYEWTLLDNGGLTGLSIPNPFNATILGSINTCNKSATITVQVKDSSPSPKTATKNFTITVVAEPALIIVRNSGDGTDNITWSTVSQREYFTASGARLGSMDWTLDSGGATGFTRVITGADTCTVKKNGTSTAGLYTFTLTATDTTCPTNKISKKLYVNVQATGSPGIVPVANNGTKTYVLNAQQIKIIPTGVSGYYLLTYWGLNSTWALHTIRIATNGEITDTSNTLTYSPGSYLEPIKVTDGLIAVAGQSGNLSIKSNSYSIGSTGNITYKTTATLFTTTSNGALLKLVQIVPNVFAVVFGNGSIGTVGTIGISSATGAYNTAAPFGSKAFPTSFVSTNTPVAANISAMFDPHAVKVSGAANIYAVTHGTYSNCRITTMKIADNGSFPAPTAGLPYLPFVDSMKYDTNAAAASDLIPITGDIYAIAYDTGSGCGKVGTVKIDSNGVMSRPAANYTYPLENNCTSTNAFGPKLVHVADQTYAVAYSFFYSSDSNTRYGRIALINIDDDGAISASDLPSYTFDSAKGIQSINIINISGDVFAVSYEKLIDSFGDYPGMVKTFNITQ